MAQTSPTGNASVARTSAVAGRVRRHPLGRVVAILAALAFVGAIAGCALIPTPALTDDEWAWCQGHWGDGLDSAQRDEPYGSTWYFNHMGMRDNPETIRVCRAAAGQR